MHAGAVSEVLAELHRAADVGARHQLGAGVAEVVCLDPPQFSPFLVLHQVVDAGTAAADARFRCFPELDLRDGSQQLAGLGLDALTVNLSLIHI